MEDVPHHNKWYTIVQDGATPTTSPSSSAVMTQSKLITSFGPTAILSVAEVGRLMESNAFASVSLIETKDAHAQKSAFEALMRLLGLG